ncbi:short-chain collagen C4-like [Mizuhopecten yessoensis]|uniref:Short-chain collagen C4 n=1 Tax=Mizuhopecten yessoensis TaxID=6573 RepID=A0A210QMA9_MIZYE|nr:short-chain collagen C4-like [Mizuhopecten yessoensis]OWF49875.1 hypothetical protein KP79_PYT13507 [Mizuhopecten yessoensis]
MVGFSVLFLCVQYTIVRSADRRILLSDPDSLNRQIIDLQAQYVQLQATINEEKLKSSTEIQQLRDTLASLSVRPAGGATFVRWGHKDCPVNVSSLVYTGFAGGSHYAHPGGAASPVCLPTEPLWGQHKDAVDDSGFMYGAEYEDHGLFGKDSSNEDVPCAVCRSPAHSSILMIPGRNVCYSGWTEAYQGDLASGYYAHPAPSENVCMDQSPQPLFGGSANQDGKLFYGVRSVCGSLRCPPYENNKFLSCVVCLQ